MNKLLSLLVSFALLFTQLAPLGYAKGSRHHRSSTPRASTSALSKNDIALVEKMLGDSENEVNWGNAQNVNTLIKAIGKDRSIKSRYANNLENGFNTANAACHHQVEAERSGAWPAICPAVKSLAKTLNIKRSVRTKFFCNTRKEWLDKADEYKCFKEGEIYGGELDEVVVIGIAKNPIKETLDILEGPEGDQDGGGQGGGNGNGQGNGQNRKKDSDSGSRDSDSPFPHADFYMQEGELEELTPEEKAFRDKLLDLLNAGGDVKHAVGEIIDLYFDDSYSSTHGKDLNPKLVNLALLTYGESLARTENPNLTEFWQDYVELRNYQNKNESKKKFVSFKAIRAIQAFPALRAVLAKDTNKSNFAIQLDSEYTISEDAEPAVLLTQYARIAMVQMGPGVVGQQMQRFIGAATASGGSVEQGLQNFLMFFARRGQALVQGAGGQVISIPVEVEQTVALRRAKDILNNLRSWAQKIGVARKVAQDVVVRVLTSPQTYAAAGEASIAVGLLVVFVLAIDDAYAGGYANANQKATALLNAAVADAIRKQEEQQTGMAGRINQAGQNARDQYVSTGTVEYQYPRAQAPALPNTGVAQPGAAVLPIESDSNWAEPTSLKKAVGFTLTAALAANMGQKELTCVYTGEKLESAEADKFTVGHLDRYLKPEDEATKRLFLCACPGKPLPSDGKNLFSEAVCGIANARKTIGSIPETCMQASLKTALRYRYSFVSSYDRRQLPFHAVYHMGRWYPEAEIPIDGENIPKTLYGVFKQFMKDKTEEMIDAVVGAAFRFDAGGGISQNMYPGANSPYDKWLRVGPDEVKKNKNGQCHIHYEEFKTERGLTYVCNHSLYFDSTGSQKNYLNTIKNLLGIGIE